MFKQGVIVGLVIVLLAAGGESFASGPHLQTRAHDSWRLTAIQDIEPGLIERFLALYPEYDQGSEPRLDGGFYTWTLSPDGHTVIVLGEFTPAGGASEQDDLICRYGLDKADLVCSTLEREAGFEPALEHMSWSPDGTQIAMHEDYFLRMYESDIWLLDVASLTLTNRTDDGVYGKYLGEKAGTSMLDYVPLWNPVTGDLYFFRSVDGDEGWSTTLCRLPKGGTEPEPVLDLGVDMSSWSVSDQSQAAISPDGTRIVIAPRAQKPPITPGLWVIDLAAATMTPLAIIEDLQVAWPRWADEERLRRMDGIALWIEQVVWGPTSDTVIVKTYNDVYKEYIPTRNYLTLDVTNKTVTYLTDYEPFGSHPALEAAVSEEPYFVTPGGVGIMAPDRGSLFYVSYEVAKQPSPFIYSAPLPFGAAPVIIGTIPDHDMAMGMVYYHNVSQKIRVYPTVANGTALIGSVLLTFR